MKKFLFLLVVLIFASTLIWGEFYKNLSQKERKELSEAYYLVGKQYQSVGKTKKGREFMQMAYNINPALDPSKIKQRSLPSAEQLIAKYSFKVELPVRKPAVEELLKSKFLRLIGNLIAEDTSGILELLDGSVYISSLDISATIEDARKALNTLFANISLLGLPPSKVYDVNSLRITKAGPYISANWGETYILEIDSLMDFSNYISFWTKHQKYYFHRVNKNWVIYCIGKNPPPSYWKPIKKTAFKASEASMAITAQPSDYEIKSKIEKNFISCVNAFLKKDIDGALAFLDDTISIMRLQTVITKADLKNSFLGYFENTDFGSTTIDDLIYRDSIFVEKTDKFAGKVAAPVYLLNVKTNIDLSNKIPFWTSYQEYYFRKSNGNWKIFAIF